MILKYKQDFGNTFGNHSVMVFTYFAIASTKYPTTCAIGIQDLSLFPQQVQNNFVGGKYSATCVEAKHRGVVLNSQNVIQKCNLSLIFIS